MLIYRRETQHSDSFYWWHNATTDSSRGSSPTDPWFAAFGKKVPEEKGNPTRLLQGVPSNTKHATIVRFIRETWWLTFTTPDGSFHESNEGQFICSLSMSVFSCCLCLINRVDCFMLISELDSWASSVASAILVLWDILLVIEVSVIYGERCCQLKKDLFTVSGVKNILAMKGVLHVFLYKSIDAIHLYIYELIYDILVSICTRVL